VQVLDIFKGITVLAFDPKAKDHAQFSSEEVISRVLHKLRRSSALAHCDGGGESCKIYLEYLERETILCEHVHFVLSKIHDDESGRHGSTTIFSTFDVRKLETALHVPVTTTESWAKKISKLLGLVVGIRDWVPRSQLIFTLELVLHNSRSMKQKLTEKNDLSGSPSGRNPSSSTTEPNQDPQADNSEEEEEEVGQPPLDQGFDHGDDQVTAAGGGQDRLVLDGDRQQSFSGSDVRNRLVAAHEHITQHKFNNESIGIVKSLTKRRYLKNRPVWTSIFEDSDSEDERRDAQTSRAHQFSGREDGESDQDDEVVEDSQREVSLGTAITKPDQYDDDELDLPVLTEYDAAHEALFPSSWGYGPPIFSNFCVASVFAQHIPLYHVPVCVSIKFNCLVCLFPCSN
jgi:hypothetical protein